MPRPRTRFQRMELAVKLARAIRGLVADHDNLADLADGIVDALGAPAGTLTARYPFFEQMLVEAGVHCCFEQKGYRLDLKSGDVVRCETHKTFSTDSEAWRGSLIDREFHRVVSEFVRKKGSNSDQGGSWQQQQQTSETR